MERKKAKQKRIAAPAGDLIPSTVYLTREERDLLADRAKAEGRNFSGEIRQTIRIALGLAKSPTAA